MATRHEEIIEWLKGAKGHEKRIKALLELSNHYFGMATKITQRMSTTFSHGNLVQQRVEDGAIALADLSQELASEAKALAAKVQTIRDTIGKIEEKQLRDLLQYRYLNGWTWERIAMDINVEVRHVYRLHERALTQIKPLYGIIKVTF